MNAESDDMFTVTVTNLSDGGDGGQGTTDEVGPKGVAVDVYNHGNGACKEAVHDARCVVFTSKRNL